MLALNDRRIRTVLILLSLGILAHLQVTECAETHADFATDPEWESYRSRLIPEPIPVTRQQFGWSSSSHAGGRGPGEIGGWIQRSITPATFAKVIPIRTLNDRLSASGKFTVKRDEGGSGILFGWFNHSSRGWRTPNSLTFRIDGNGGKYWVFFEYGTRDWLTGGGATFEGRYQTTKTKPFRSDGTVHTWSLDYDPAGAEGQGVITFVLDGTSYTCTLAPGHKVNGAEFDRFGVLNQQLTGDGMEAYFADLVLDGRKLELSQDPQWESKGNRVEFADRQRRPFHDFGWMSSNRSGTGPGEVGGVIWRDAKPAYYAAKTDTLNLDRPLFATGSISFNGAGSDSGACFGWFDSQSKIQTEAIEGQDKHRNILAIVIEGPSRAGHYFRAAFRATNGSGGLVDTGPLIRPDATRHRWELKYTPVGDGGDIAVKFDDHVQITKITREERQAGAHFDRFGIFNIQTGGHYVDFALDDLTYTSSP